MQRFGIPGKLLAGSDSHTCAAGSLGMLAIGTGGLDVAMAMAVEPLYLRMPEIWGIELTGTLPAWVSAKDVVLEMLRRHGVKGGVNRIIEYHGDGLAGLTAMDRHVIANMGAELAATTTVFPSDGAVASRSQHPTITQNDEERRLGILTSVFAAASTHGSSHPAAGLDASREAARPWPTACRLRSPAPPYSWSSPSSSSWS
jgi:homoaconitase/3-isopropylmalate dehydratase large subunit